MKFYNIFKPHIVVDTTGKYAIGRFNIFGLSIGWEYLDNVDAKFWWDRTDNPVYYTQNNLEEAKKLLVRYIVLRHPIKNKFNHEVVL